MASSTAIGSASVVLSANADGLAAGLDKAERKVNDFAGDVGKRLDKAGGSGGGGFLSKLLGGAAIGGAAGAVAGAVAGGVMKGFEVLSGIPDLIRGLAEKASGPEAGPLKGIVAALDRVQAIAERVGGKLFASMGPGFLAIADLAEGLNERFGGLVEKIGTGLGAALSFGAEVGGELLTVVGEVAEELFHWSAELLGFSDTADGAGKLAMGIFRGVAKAAAYVWDTIKFGAGVIATVYGGLIRAVASVNDAYAAFLSTVAGVPGAPACLKDSSRLAYQISDSIRGFGQGLSDWGAEAMNGFGDSAARVDRWMDGVESRFAQRGRELAQVAEGALKPLESKLGGALLKGSQESYSVVTKFQTQGMVSAADPATKQLRQQEEANRLLREIARGIAAGGILRTI